MSVNQVREHIGTVTEEEKNEVLSLFERINGLQELLPVLETRKEFGSDNKTLYDRVISDLGSTKMKQDAWWTRMGNKYQWTGRKNAHWSIDFDTNFIYLVLQ